MLHRMSLKIHQMNRDSFTFCQSFVRKIQDLAKSSTCLLYPLYFVFGIDVNVCLNYYFKYFFEIIFLKVHLNEFLKVHLKEALSLS